MHMVRPIGAYIKVFSHQIILENRDLHSLLKSQIQKKITTQIILHPFLSHC